MKADGERFQWRRLLGDTRRRPIRHNHFIASILRHRTRSLRRPRHARDGAILRGK